MDNYQIQFTGKAWSDMDAIAEFHLHKVGPQSAAQITDRILDTIEQLQTFPYMGPLHTDPILAKHQYRKLVCGNYVCIYKVNDMTIYIYRIVHGSTNYPNWAL